MLPEEMKGCKTYGVEIDPVSARLAKQLYQKTQIANEGYENTSLPDSFFDAAVGNVPFGDFCLADQRYDQEHFLIHDYFFAKTKMCIRDRIFTAQTPQPETAWAYWICTMSIKPTAIPPRP